MTGEIRITDPPLHKCDECCAKAYHRVTSPVSGFYLDLCNHHLNAYSEPLADWALYSEWGASGRS